MSQKHTFSAINGRKCVLYGEGGTETRRSWSRAPGTLKGTRGSGKGCLGVYVAQNAPLAVLTDRSKDRSVSQIQLSVLENVILRFPSLRGIYWVLASFSWTGPWCRAWSTPNPNRVLPSKLARTLQNTAEAWKTLNMSFSKPPRGLLGPGQL